jgi:hypothetical protein
MAKTGASFEDRMNKALWPSSFCTICEVLTLGVGRMRGETSVTGIIVPRTREALGVASASGVAPARDIAY